MVSVIIPCYNAGKTIRRAIESVISQTCTDAEIIVVDDGSSDGSIAEVEALKGRYSGGMDITVVRQDNAGPAKARNEGISRARGEYLAFLDSDDYWLPSKLSEQLDLMERHGLSLLGCLPVKRAGLKEGTVRLVGLSGMLFSNPFVTSSVMVKSGVCRSGGLVFPEGKRYSEDFLLWLRIASRYPSGVVSSDAVVHTSDSREALSKNLRAMEAGEIDTLISVLRERLFRRRSFLAYPLVGLAVCFSVIKFAKRVCACAAV